MIYYLEDEKSIRDLMVYALRQSGFEAQGFAEAKSFWEQLIEVRLVDDERHIVKVDGEEVTLTFKEYELLRFLMENPGVAFDRERLLSAVWGQDYFGGTRTVDVHIQTLRQKLKRGGECIETIRRLGYRLGGSEK